MNVYYFSVIQMSCSQDVKWGRKDIHMDGVIIGTASQNATTEFDGDRLAAVTIPNPSYDEFIDALFDRAFGPYEVKVGGEYV